jgi:hypothetical protein
VSRVSLVVVLVGAMFAASAFFLLKTRVPDDRGDGNRPNPPAVRELPPRPDAPSSREPNAAAPRPPDPPAPPSSKRRAAPPAAAAPPPATPATRETATLRIVSDVPGAQVFLNREFMGAAPVTKSDLQPGSYQLNVSAPGYDNHIETIDVTPGNREINVRFREVRLNASIAVVHKHRFGSCSGTLVATPQGIRYDTADKNDGFESTLVDLETFQVDYLSKNLRVQPRKGRRYDFTDPDGNADRLFVFHRDVERVRERLKQGDRPAG